MNDHSKGEKVKKRISHILRIVLCLSYLVVGVALAQNDVKGSKDHPLITRMPDYHISKYVVSDFGAFDPTVIGGKAVHWEGKKYSYGYTLKESGSKQVSMLQIVRNYEAAIRKIDGKILGGDERRVAAEISKGGALTGVYVEAFSEGRYYELTIVESQPMQQEVVADASAMQNDLTASGKTIVHGIYFATGSATIKPESEPALAEMVKLLNGSPALKVHIVGHTDSDGSLDSNIKLSSDRAASVVKALNARGITAARLRPVGVGPYSPVASNGTDDGRAKNRRVELVKQ
jgi:OmpA-OmpF porin, OOP family